MIFWRPPLIALACWPPLPPPMQPRYSSTQRWAAPCSGSKLERHPVSVVRVCGDQLHRERDLCRICGNRLVARRVRLGHPAATGDTPEWRKRVTPRRDCASQANTGANPVPANIRQLTNISFIC